MKPAFNIGDKVYLKTDLNQIPRIIVAITLQAGGSIVYTLIAEAEQSYHHEIELQTERDVILATSNFNDK